MPEDALVSQGMEAQAEVAGETQQEPAGARSEAGGTDGTPQADGEAQSGSNAQEQADLPEPHVPWGKFRAVQTDFTRFKRQAEQERRQFEEQMVALQSELDQLRRVREDYELVESLLDKHPEIAEQLYAVAKESGAADGRAAGDRGAQAVSPEFQTLAQEVRELKRILEQDRQQQLLRRQMEQDREIGEQLDRTLTTMLAKAGMDSAWLPHVRGYVLERARELPGLELDDVPYLFAEWRKPMRELLNKQVDAWRRGKEQDRQSLPPVPGSAQSVAPREKLGANDNRTVKVLAEMLRAKGWQ